MPPSPAQMPKAYLVYVAFSVLDAVGTWIILSLGGVEVNPVANWFLSQTGYTGMVLYKFCMVSVVISSCNVIILHRPKVASAIMRAAIAASCLPVVVVLIELLCHTIELAR